MLKIHPMIAITHGLMPWWTFYSWTPFVGKTTLLIAHSSIAGFQRSRFVTSFFPPLSLSLSFSLDLSLPFPPLHINDQQFALRSGSCESVTINVVWPASAWTATVYPKWWIILDPHPSPVAIPPLSLQTYPQALVTLSSRPRAIENVLLIRFTMHWTIMEEFYFSSIVCMYNNINNTIFSKSVRCDSTHEDIVFGFGLAIAPLHWQ